MAPSPENDSAPKAPDKCEKQKSDKAGFVNNQETNKDEKAVLNLNDRELKALLDEAITYKNPKDREGKSELFNDLLLKAEETERIARAASAGGSELVRHCNPSARRNGRHGRRKPSSISENVMHGGSLDNLAKEELFESTHHLHITRKSVRVSARQREGGSLPCNVNSSVTPSRDYQFLEEAKKNKAMKDKEYTAIDMETESLLENDHLAQSYQDQVPPIDLVQAGQFQKFTTKATLQISGANVDDPIGLDLDGSDDNKKSFDMETVQAKLAHSKYKVYIPKPEEKRVDENGNALHQTKTKKKKAQTDKNVVVLAAESVEGHRSDIITDVNKLMEYIEGTDNVSSSSKIKTVHKSKQLHKQHVSEDGGRSKKQRAHSSKGKESRSDLKKSNSLGEISTAKLDEFAFTSGGGGKEDKVVLRGNKATDRPRERRSWGNVESPSFQTLYSNVSVENLEALDNWEVTKPKKKSKKRRNSISSGRRQNPNAETSAKHITTRAPSPDLRGKSACSMPHSEKSNDSSDVDSVHSLPLDGPISYADIAKNSEKLKDKKASPEKSEKVPNPTSKEKSPLPKLENEVRNDVAKVSQQTNNVIEKNNVINNVKNVPPDVHNIKSFPAIASVVGKVQTEKTNKNSVTVKKQNSPNSNKSVKNNNNNNNNSNKEVSKGSNGNGGVCVNSTPVQDSCVHQTSIDIQTDLSIIKANERDYIQFNARMLPPDIPDVQTIEKMHFMNHSPNYQARASPPPSLLLPPPPPLPNPIPNDLNSIYCDNDERTIIDGVEDDRPPPVVILSGINNNEVPGLVFGFDVNEQLLKEDVCDNFIARFVPPDMFNHSSHNHDKIVNFVGAAWESVMNQSNGKVQYYTEEL